MKNWLLILKSLTQLIKHWVCFLVVTSWSVINFRVRLTWSLTLELQGINWDARKLTRILMVKKKKKWLLNYCKKEKKKEWLVFSGNIARPCWVFATACKLWQHPKIRGGKKSKIYNLVKVTRICNWIAFLNQFDSAMKMS